MPQVQYSGNTLTTPEWRGDFGGREHVLPAPARLDAAAFTANAQGQKYVQSGTLVGRTYAERDAKAGFGPADVGDDEIYLTYYDTADALVNAEVEFYRPTSLVKENYLPNWGTLIAGLKTILRARYQCVSGTD